ncbi:caspase family protein [Amycolatopsis sp. H6(2020)]|nr:caspase family protein [Amycolatopsis sp. H6(2020)]
MIVANGEYDNAGLQRLGSPAADADALAGVLADRAISDFEVAVVRNETAHVVQAEIEDLCLEGKPDDVLLMHFSCHGLKDDAGGLYFAARNTRPDRLRSTAVSAEFVQQCIRQSRSRSIVLLLDCCYGGAFGQGVAVRASGDANVLDSFRGGRGRAVITASNSIEYAFEGATLASDEPARPSVFTSALVEGLRTGEADRDEDGLIALGELYEYLFDRVRERNPKQTPSRDIEMQGELYLAKSRRRRIKPSAIPPDLAAAIGAENPFTRLGAVAELRRRLSSSNLPVAMGAFEALRVMASTDIEHVAAAASDALSFAVVRVDVASVRLSAVAGSRASAALRVLGPPVAREVRFEASHPWIGVAEVSGGAELSVTAGESGTRQGKVVVRGPTGDVVVEVEIEALPAAVPVAEPEAVAEAEADLAPEPEAVVSEAEPEAVVAEAEPEPAAPEPAAEPEPAVGAVPEPAAAAAPDSVVAEQTGRFAADSEPEPVVAVAAQPAAAAPVPGARPATEPAGAMDPVGGFAGVVAIAGAVFAVAGLPLNYRYDYSLTQYRPGMESAVLIVAACALLAGILTLTPRTRSLTGPALLFGTGLAALFGLLRFFGEAIALSQNGDTELKTGYTFALLAHIAWLVAGASALGALRRNPAVALGAGPVRGWPAWVAIGLGVTAATGWIVQLVDLNTYDSSDAGRATAYFLLGALLAVSVPVVAMALRPSPVGCAVLATGTAGLLGVLAPTFAAVAEASSLALGGQVIAVVALVLLAADTVVLAVRARNQPNGRQS